MLPRCFRNLLLQRAAAQHTALRPSGRAPCRATSRHRSLQGASAQAEGSAPAATEASPPAHANGAGPGPASLAAAANVANGSTPGLSEAQLRRRRRVLAEIIEASRRGKVAATPQQIEEGLQALEALLPGFEVDMEKLKASDWGRLAADAVTVGAKIILLKSHYPRLDLARVLAKQPRMLLQSYEDLDRSAQQVKVMLERAKDLERLLGAVPELLDAKTCVSVLTTVTKWYHLEKDPIEVLEMDPELVQRAQDMDVPFEPVYVDENGNWTAPLLNYREKRTSWQAYIDQTRYKQP